MTITQKKCISAKANGKWELTPAYDVCYSSNLFDYWVSQQTLSIKGKGRNVTLEDLLSIAKSNSIRLPEKIIAGTIDVVSRWCQYAEDQYVHAQLRDEINQALVSQTWS